MSSNRSSKLVEEAVIIEPAARVFSEQEWRQLLSRNDLFNISQSRLRESLLYGIPSHLRGEIWAFLSKANRLAMQFSDSVYLRLIQQEDPMIENQLVKDLHRTFPEHDMFRDTLGYGQRGLLNILRAYAAYDTEVGYCQGMGFIVGILLMHMNSEEHAFWTFVQIMFDKNWRLVFKSGTPKLCSMLESLEKQMKRKLPDIAQHFLRQEIEYTMCFSQCLITIFLYDAPLELSTRIMDMFLFEGEQILFTVILKMLQMKRDKILHLKVQDLYLYIRHRMIRECFQEYHIQTLLSPLSQAASEREMVEYELL